MSQSNALFAKNKLFSTHQNVSKCWNISNLPSTHYAIAAGEIDVLTNCVFDPKTNPGIRAHTVIFVVSEES